MEKQNSCPFHKKFKLPVENRPFSQQLGEFLDTTIGRDRFFRFFQFYAKFIVPLIKNKDSKMIGQLATFLESFGALSNMTRKMLRIGRYVNSYRSILARLNKPKAEKECNDIIKTLCDTINIIYLMLDHILLANKLNVFKFNPAWISKIDLYANLAWGGECISNITYDVIDYYNYAQIITKLKNDMGKIQNMESEGKILCCINNCNKFITL